MPRGFDACRKRGGKITTKTLSGGKYVHVCSIDGKSYRGYVKTKGSSKDGGSPVASAIKKRMGKSYGG